MQDYYATERRARVLQMQLRDRDQSARAFRRALLSMAGVGVVIYSVLLVLS